MIKHVTMTSISHQTQGNAFSYDSDPDWLYKVRVRLIKIRTFSKSLKICTGILSSSKRHIVDAEYADAENNDLPNFSRVQVLCRKGTISTEHFGELVKIEKEEVAQKRSIVKFTLILFQL